MRIGADTATPASRREPYRPQGPCPATRSRAPPIAIRVIVRTFSCSAPVTARTRGSNAPAEATRSSTSGRCWRADAKAPETGRFWVLLRLLAGLDQVGNRGDHDQHQCADPDDVDLAARRDSRWEWAIRQNSLTLHGDHVGAERHRGRQDGRKLRDKPFGIVH